MSDTILVEFNRQMLQDAIARDGDGNRLSIEISEPDARGISEVTITRHTEDNPMRVTLEALTTCCADEGARDACRLRKHFGEQIDPELGYDPWEAECGFDDSPEYCAYHPIFDALLPLPTPEAGEQR